VFHFAQILASWIVCSSRRKSQEQQRSDGNGGRARIIRTEGGAPQKLRFRSKKKEEKETEIKFVLAFVLAFVFDVAATLGIKAFY
jgi:hypothetical protein